MTIINIVIGVIVVILLLAIGFEAGRRFQAYIDDEWGD